jgi:hypothetical protein
MAEAWRHNKHILYAAIPAHTQLHIFLVFTGTTMPGYETVNTAVVNGINKLVNNLAEENQAQKNI